MEIQKSKKKSTKHVVTLKNSVRMKLSSISAEIYRENVIVLGSYTGFPTEF